MPKSGGPGRKKFRKGTAPGGELALQSRASLKKSGPHQWTPLETAIVELYGRGVNRKAIVVALLDRIAPPKYEDETILARKRRAHQRLRALERRPWFRDKLWELAMVFTDLELGEVMKGVVREGKKGRVDAARLALEVTGRHDPHRDATPSNIQVHFGFLPRPERTHVTVEGVLLDEEEELS